MKFFSFSSQNNDLISALHSRQYLEGLPSLSLLSKADRCQSFHEVSNLSIFCFCTTDVIDKPEDSDISPQSSFVGLLGFDILLSIKTLLEMVIFLTAACIYTYFYYLVRI